MTAILEPLESDFRDDPGLTDLIRAYVDDLSNLRDQLGAAANAGDAKGLLSLAHQLRGTGGTFGYADLSLAATELEHAVRLSSTIDERVRSVLRAIFRLIDRVQAGSPPP